MDGGGGHNGYNGGYDMSGNPVVNGSTPPMPTPPPAHEPQHHYGRGRGGRARGGYGQSFAHQQHSQSYPSQYTSPQWQQQQPFYPQQNGAYNPYAQQPFNPYLNNAAYYNQQYNNYPYYAAAPGYSNYIPPQPSPMYAAQAHQSPYQQSQYAVVAPQQPIANGPNSPFSQPHLPAAQPMATVGPNVPLTPASAHSSQFVPAPPSEPIQLRGGTQPVESPAPSIQDDQPVNGNDVVESDNLQQPAESSTPEMPSVTGFEIPMPNPTFSFNQVPFYTDPDSKQIFTTQKRAKKRFRPIEGHEMTMQTSQPGQGETPAADPSADGLVPAGEAPDSSEKTVPDNEVVSEISAPSDLNPTAEVAKSIVGDSSAVEPNDLPKDESVPTPPTAPIANGTTVEKESSNDKNGASESSGGEPTSPAAKPEAVPIRPKTWAHLLKKEPVASKPATDAQATVNGTGETESSGGLGVGQSSTRALGDVLRTYDPSKGNAFFIEPRGLYNARVDCYMISILQALLYCTPFYRFLHQVKMQSAQSLKSHTPLLDALIDFQGNFRVIKSADSPKQLRESLTPEQHRQYGETLHANSVFDAAFRLPAIKNLERGKQQDAEEFLILLLGALSDECVKVIGAATGDSSSQASFSNDGAANDWKTVEKNGKPAVTQSSGLPELPNPVSKIFKGKMRSEVRHKNQVTNTDQPFTNLKLHIEDQSIKSISDALLRFNAAENVGVTDNKTSQSTTSAKLQQTFIHKLPHILVIHLVRFESTGTAWAKNGKHVDYPLDLEIPSTILSKPARIEYAEARRYRLMSVVYHHGSDKDSGHYSIDVRRQDDESWLRINDTQVTAVDSSDVVGSDKNASSKSAGARKENSTDGLSNNRFAAMSDNTDGGAWQNVGASGSGGKKSSNVGNGKASGTSTPRGTPIKDNKVAYLLFYQKLK